MDIRRFFSTKGEKRKHTSPSPPGSHGVGSDNQKEKAVSEPTSQPCSSTSKQVVAEGENDVGKWVGKSGIMTPDEKTEMLKNHWTPPPSYNFANDATHLKRKFIHNWLEKYSPWLTYSRHLKGALCLYCVMFPPLPAVQGVQGSFVVRPFTKYKNIHEYCRNHVESRYHLSAVKAAKLFLDNVPVNVQMVTAHQALLTENKKLIASVTSTIIFCGVHDLPLRGAEQHEGIFEDIIRLKIESGDTELKLLTEGAKNANYKSPRIQNELIDLCGKVVTEMILGDVKKAYVYSVLADETADISGVEQLSIGIRFFDMEKMVVREEFIGFVPLEAMDAKTIANAIDCLLDKNGLDPEKCVGQGYDGCSTMAGKDGGVQRIMRGKYKKALYFHCASHRLNLVVNDLNSVAEIRNTVSTIKDIINFFRESVLRRKYIPNIPALCETRWSEKYRSISIFMKNFVELVEALEKMAEEGNVATKKSAFQLYCAATKPVFIISTCIMSKYSSMLEPVVNILQSKSLDLFQCSNHIKKILTLVKDHREKCDATMDEIYTSAKQIAEKLMVNLQPPRVINRQQNRSNPPFATHEEYWMRAVLIPYLDSFSASLGIRFSEDNLTAFSLLSLHPSLMLKLMIEELKEKIKMFAEFYELNGLESKIELWHNDWSAKKLDDEELKKLDMVEVLKEAITFFPTIKQALLISIALPCSTATIEGTFSTLRRVKTWTRSTMTERRLNGLCLMSVHRKLISEKKNYIEEAVVNKFAENPRRLMLS